MDELYDNIQNISLIFEDLSIDFDKNCDKKKFFLIFKKLIDGCFIKPLNKCEDNPYLESDFEGVADRAQSYIPYLIKIIQNFVLAYKKNVSYEKEFEQIILDSLYISLQYTDPQSFWSNVSSADIAKELIKLLVKLSGHETEDELLFGKDYSKINEEDIQKNNILFPNGILKLLVPKISECFNKKSWKQNPPLLDSYLWMLAKVKGPKNTSCYIYFFLPPALFLLDDWELRHKIIGAKALTHILEETGFSDLRLFGRAEVIFDSLKHQLYSRDEPLLKVVYPAVIKAAAILESDPKNIGTTKKNNYDFIMDYLIREMTFEQKLALRNIYIVNLHRLIIAMEIFSIRWTKEILEVCSCYLETFEGPSACDRIITIKIIKQFVSYCWPRIHEHALSILQMVCKVVYETSNSSSNIEDEAVSTIVNESKELVNLLYEAAPLTIRDKCSSMNNLRPDSKENKALLYIFEDVLKEL